MKIQGEHHFQAPREKVWQTVIDPKVLSSSVPGFQRLDTIGEHEYEGALEIRIGPVQGDFQGTLELSDLNPPASYRFRLNGMGAAGFVDGEGLLVLEESGGGTRLHYDMDAKVGGRIAGVGQRLLDSSAKVFARQTLEGLERQFVPRPASAPARRQAEPGAVPTTVETSAPAPGSSRPARVPPPSTRKAGKSKALESPAAGAPSAAPAPPGQVRFALKFAKGLAGELIPASKRPWVLGAALVAYTIVVILLTRACSGQG